MLVTPDSPTNGASLDFDRDVLQASRERPILVDFWAPWCGPCRVLGPLLDKLADEANGDWRLVKINTDDNPALSQAAGIRGIPAVKLYVEGTVAAEFTGALPEPILRRWLDEHLPSEEKRLLEEARQLLDTDNLAHAIGRLERVLEKDPTNEDARVMLARLIALDDIEKARGLLQGLEHRPEAEAVSTVVAFRRADTEVDLPDGPGRADFMAAARALRTGNVDEALRFLTDALQKDRYYHDDAPRKVIVALFTLLGETHPLTKKYRPVFNRSLY